MAATTCLSETFPGQLFIRNISGRRDDIWALRELRDFRTTPSAPFQLTTGPMSLGPPVPSPDGTKVFAEGVLPAVNSSVTKVGRSSSCPSFREFRQENWTFPEMESGLLTFLPRAYALAQSDRRQRRQQLTVSAGCGFFAPLVSGR